VYAKYSRGGGFQNDVGTLGKAFAYKRQPLMMAALSISI
jgi:hypothetical protein